MRIPRTAPPLLLALLLMPGVHAYDVVHTGLDCTQATTAAPAETQAATGASCGGSDGICSPVFIEFELDPLKVTPVFRPECIEQTIQDVRELVGI